MKKDKITAEIIGAINKIESNEKDFTKRRQKLIEKYIEIYTSPDITSTDLIKRKNYILHWGNHYLTVFLGLILSEFVTYILNALDVFQDVNIPIIQTEGDYLGLIVMVCISIGVSVKLSDLFTYSNDIHIRYNTMEFEVNLIDEILEKECHLMSIKQKIIDVRCNASHTPAQTHIVKVVKKEKRCPCVLSYCKNEQQK